MTLEAVSGVPDVPDKHPRGPEEYKAVAAALGLPNIRGLMALSWNAEPFYTGTPAHRRDAEWFAELWQQHGWSDGVHLRRIHYRLVSGDERPLTPSGEVYGNDVRSWDLLLESSKRARALELVDPAAFDDRRNKGQHLNRRPRTSPADPVVSWEPWEPVWSLPEVEAPRLPAIGAWLLPGWPGSDGWELPNLRVPRVEPQISGYDYDPDDQPVLVEVWVEKSTADDILEPLCAEAHVNYVTAAGTQSITSAVKLCQRAARHRRPAHVVYISDHDPAGEGMPMQVARQIEFHRERYGVEVSVEHLVLTPEQVAEYDLPRVPIKESDKRKAGFEGRHGVGAVELDALEAIHPGVLADLVRRAISPYRDPTLPTRLDVAGQDAEHAVSTAWTDATADLRGDLSRLSADLAAVRDRYQRRVREAGRELEELQRPFRRRLAELGQQLASAQAPIKERLEALAEEMATELTPYQERLDALAEDAARISREFDPDLPARPEPDEPDVDRDALLYDSRRHWLDQLAVYQRVIGGPRKR